MWGQAQGKDFYLVARWHFDQWLSVSNCLLCQGVLSPWTIFSRKCSLCSMKSVNRFVCSRLRSAFRLWLKHAVINKNSDRKKNKKQTNEKNQKQSFLFWGHKMIFRQQYMIFLWYYSEHNQVQKVCLRLSIFQVHLPYLHRPTVAAHCTCTEHPLLSQGVKLLPEESTIQLKEKHPNMTDFLGKPLTSFFLNFSFLFHVFHTCRNKNTNWCQPRTKHFPINIY